MSYARAANIRVTPEAMTTLLPLPPGVQVIRLTGMPDGTVLALAVGEAMPEVVGTPQLIDSTELHDLPPSPTPSYQESAEGPAEAAAEEEHPTDTVA